jgi:hypothetical protein
MKKVFALATIVLLLGLAPSAMAQQTGVVTGTVTDATGALIPGAEVTATNNNTGISTLGITGETGSYTLQGLQAGPYDIVASLPGFSDATIEVNVTANQTFRFNFELQVGTVASAIEVVSDADALLATTGASVGDALPEEEVLALPLATRDVFDLLNTTAGLVRGEGGDAANFAGGRVSSVNTTRDGIPVSDGRYLDWNGAFSATYSSPDLVEEVQISVGTVDAAAGRGSSQIRLQTRSGTNEFHGALFFGSNNSALNANSWFNNLNGRERNWTNRNQYGGRIGGPIVRNKAFFFVLIDNQQYRTRRNVTGNVLTPTAAQGIFRYFPGLQNDDAAGGSDASVDANGNPRDWTQVAGATGPMQTLNLFTDISTNRGTAISSNAYIQETLRRMPTPNNFRTGDGLNTAGIDWVRADSGSDNAAGTSQDTNREQLNIRFDYQITDSNKINAVMSRESNVNNSSNPSWPNGEKGEATRKPKIYSFQYTASVTPTVLNEFRMGYRVTNWHGRPAVAAGCCFGKDEFDGGLTPEAKELFETNYSFSNGYPYLARFSTLGAPWLPGANGMRSQNSPLYNFSDNLSWIQGAHSFQAGWEGNWADSDGWNGGGLWPFVTLGNGAFDLSLEDVVADLDENAGLAENILNDLAGSVDSYGHDYLVNDPSKGFDTILDTPKQNLNYHQDDWAAFFKDDWNITQNLTINLGVRWDVYGVPYEAKGLNTTAKDFNFGGISGNGSLTQIIPVGKNSVNPDINIYSKDWNNFAPSLGFSYRIPWLDRQTVLRGGYGISYSGAPTFLQYDFGPARNPGKKANADVVDPLTYTAIPGSTNAAADLVSFPNAPNPAVPYGTIQFTDNCRATGCNLLVYSQDRRIPYIQNMNMSIETELAANTNLSVTWISTNGVSLWGGRQLNEPNLAAADQGETWVQAFNITRAGGDSALFQNMFQGLTLGGQTVGTGAGQVSASNALRDWTSTDDYFADGEAGGLAEFVSETNRGGGGYGGMLRTNGYPENFLKFNPQFNQVDLYNNNDNSSYHSLQTQLTKRTSSGFSGQFTYTWAKTLGNSATSGFRAREDQSFGTRDPNNINLQKGRVGFDRTHAFNAHGVWSLPFGPGRLLGSGAPSVVARLIEGWQLSSIFSWGSGAPISVTSSMETLSAEDDVNSPDLVGGFASFGKATGEVNVGTDGNITYMQGFTREREPTLDYYGTNPDSLQSHDNLWQIKDASGNVILRNPKPGTTGNLGYGWLTGPSSLGLDVAMSKSVQINEGTEFTIRFDSINLLNTPQWGSPNLNINSNSFGRITSAGGARTFTMNARIDF